MLDFQIMVSANDAPRLHKALNRHGIGHQGPEIRPDHTAWFLTGSRCNIEKIEKIARDAQIPLQINGQVRKIYKIGEEVDVDRDLSYFQLDYLQAKQIPIADFQTTHKPKANKTKRPPKRKGPKRPLYPKTGVMPLRKTEKVKG